MLPSPTPDSVAPSHLIQPSLVSRRSSSPVTVSRESPVADIQQHPHNQHQHQYHNYQQQSHQQPQQQQPVLPVLDSAAATRAHAALAAHTQASFSLDTIQESPRTTRMLARTHASLHIPQVEAARKLMQDSANNNNTNNTTEHKEMLTQSDEIAANENEKLGNNITIMEIKPTERANASVSVSSESIEMDEHKEDEQEAQQEQKQKEQKAQDEKRELKVEYKQEQTEDKEEQVEEKQEKKNQEQNEPTLSESPKIDLRRSDGREGLSSGEFIKPPEPRGNIRRSGSFLEGRKGKDLLDIKQQRYVS